MGENKPLNLREELHHSLFRGLKSLAAIDLPTRVTFEDLQIWLKCLNLLVPQEGLEPPTPSFKITGHRSGQSKGAFLCPGTTSLS